jgi:hypothetical protein
LLFSNSGNSDSDKKNPENPDSDKKIDKNRLLKMRYWQW